MSGCWGCLVMMYGRLNRMRRLYARLRCCDNERDFTTTKYTKGTKAKDVLVVTDFVIHASYYFTV